MKAADQEKIDSGVVRARVSCQECKLVQGTFYVCKECGGVTCSGKRCRHVHRKRHEKELEV